MLISGHGLYSFRDPVGKGWHNNLTAVPTVPNAVCVYRQTPARWQVTSRVTLTRAERLGHVGISPSSLQLLLPVREKHKQAARCNTAQRGTTHLERHPRLSRSHTLRGEQCSHVLRARPNLGRCDDGGVSAHSLRSSSRLTGWALSHLKMCKKNNRLISLAPSTREVC